MNTPPHKITILADHPLNTGFTVLCQSCTGELSVAESLCYDEMLGYIARLCCPTFSDGEPFRGYGRPLFLSPPKNTNP